VVRALVPADPVDPEPAEAALAEPELVEPELEPEPLVEVVTELALPLDVPAALVVPAVLCLASAGSCPETS
jgi:hypothetical protein